MSESNDRRIWEADGQAEGVGTEVEPYPETVRDEDWVGGWLIWAYMGKARSEKYWMDIPSEWRGHGGNQ